MHIIRIFIYIDTVYDVGILKAILGYISRVKQGLYILRDHRLFYDSVGKSTRYL